MHLAKVIKEGEVVVVEIRPDNPALRIIYRILFAALVIGGLALIWYVSFKYQNLRFWLDARMGLMIMAYLFIFFIIFRHWAWFTRGKEVAVIYPDKIHYYRDLWLFAEGKVKQDYKKIEVIYRQDTSQKNEEDATLVDEILVKKETAVVGFRIDDDEVISTFLPIALDDGQKIAQLVGTLSKN
ncbi:MAG: hypothetical protein ACI94Y_002376 [Maribacter sp.]|jgi:hypothetical protein